MKTSFARLAVLLPLLWALVLALPAYGKRKHAADLAQIDFTRPVATLATPERTIAIFRLVPPETTDWSYMIVTVNEDGVHMGYGDEANVGGLVKDLAFELLPAARATDRVIASTDDSSFPHAASGRRADNRCPTASGWHFETTGVRVNYCSEGLESDRIERVMDLLTLTPDAAGHS